MSSPLCGSPCGEYEISGDYACLDCAIVESALNDEGFENV